RLRRRRERRHPRGDDALRPALEPRYRDAWRCSSRDGALPGGASSRRAGRPPARLPRWLVPAQRLRIPHPGDVVPRLLPDQPPADGLAAQRPLPARVVRAAIPRRPPARRLHVRAARSARAGRWVRRRLLHVRGGGRPLLADRQDRLGDLVHAERHGRPPRRRQHPTVPERDARRATQEPEPVFRHALRTRLRAWQPRDRLPRDPARPRPGSAGPEAWAPQRRRVAGALSGLRTGARGVSWPTVSAALLANGEEQHIVACLGGLAWADELVVLDGLGTGRLPELARAQGATVHYRPFDNFGAQRQALIELTSCDWIFFVDVDERVSAGLAREVRSVI